MSIEKITLPEQHYIYVASETDFSPEAISAAIGSGFQAVFGFVGANQIQPLSAPITLYTDIPNGPKMAFRAGVFVSAEDAAKASGNIQAATIPAGDAVTAMHVGPYARLSETHKAIWDHCDASGYTKGRPVWEVYVDDPTQVAEAELKTVLYRAVS